MTKPTTLTGFQPAIAQEVPNPERESWLRGLLSPGADYGSVGLYDLQYLFQALDAARADLAKLADAVRYRNAVEGDENTTTAQCMAADALVYAALPASPSVPTAVELTPEGMEAFHAMLEAPGDPPQPLIDLMSKPAGPPVRPPEAGERFVVLASGHRLDPKDYTRAEAEAEAKRRRALGWLATVVPLAEAPK